MSQPQTKPMKDSLSDLTREILQFRDDRDWAQFHTLRQLAAAIAIEAAELQEVLLWKNDEQATEMLEDERGAKRIRHELADLLIYTLLMAASVGVDPADAIREKLSHNGINYPVNDSKGRSTKYTELPRGSG